MSADSFGFPLPVYVQGYACLTEEEAALAQKGVDPVHPQESGQPAQSDTAGGSWVKLDRERLDAVRQTMQASAARVVSYTPAAVRTAALDTGLVFSARA